MSWRWVQSTHLCSQGKHVVAVEGWVESTHLVEDTADGPHVRLLTVRLTLHNLGTAINADAKPE